MIQEIKMPSAGQTTDEAKIVAVNVKVGDTVKRGDVLVEAETDKSVLPVESFAAGQVLAVLVKVGDPVDAGTVLVAVGKPGEVYPSGTQSAQPPQPQPAPVVKAPVAAPRVGTEIKMPSAGQTTDEAKIVAVNVKIGDTVKRGDVLVEAETDKAVLPVESFAAGQVLDVLVKVGDTVTAGTVLAVVGKASEAGQYVRGGTPEPAAVPEAVNQPPVAEKPEYLPILKGQEPVCVPAKAPVETGKAAPAMPNAKLLAKQTGVALSQVTPSNGQFIKRQDVANYHPAEETAPASSAAAEKELAYEVLPMTRMRKTIARRMTESVQQIPAFQCTVSVDMTQCIQLRETFLKAKGIKLSYNDILAKAIAVAAEKYPLLNTRYENQELRLYRHTNVGLAVGLEQALVVPVVRDVEQKGLACISQEYKALVTKARENKLAPGDMGCGSITISNLGMYDVDNFVAIVNPPECGILAVGSIRKEPVWDGTTFQPVPMMRITGSFDHRIIDGAYGAQILREIKALMEQPSLMLG